MKQHTTAVISQKPSSFIDMPYTPALLLDSGFDASITDQPDFPESCSWGFDAYFDGLYVYDEALRNHVFVDRFFSRKEILQYARRNIAHAYEAEHIPLSMCAGVVLGWLSALALVQYEDAYAGLCFLRSLIQSYTPMKPDRICGLRACGGDGFSLDV